MNKVRYLNRTHKNCNNCKELKPVGEFYKKRKNLKCGTQYYHGLCKMCEKRYRAGMQEWYKKYLKGWRITHKDYIIAKQEEIRKARPERNKCRLRTRYHVRVGNLKKFPCVVCGVVTVHAHHPDYNDHMRIVWLCPQHHSLLHAGDYKLVDDRPVLLFDRFNNH
jgi:hypothetical protein